MKAFHTLELQGKAGSLRTLTPVLPNLWQGECDCIVGPFSGREVAEYFAGVVVDFGQLESFTHKVFAKRDAWYVEVQACPDALSYDAFRYR